MKNLTPLIYYYKRDKHFFLRIIKILYTSLSLCQDKDSEAEESTRQAVSMAERIAGEGTFFAARAMLCLAGVLDSVPGEAFPLLQ